jgi:peptide/nickel transport system permease protein
MRAALTPIVTIFGLDLGLPSAAPSSPSPRSTSGLGKLALDAINQKDLPVIMGVDLARCSS